MKATALLKKQHRKVEGIFEKLENGGADSVSELTELANDLAAHMAIEQNLFYPAVRDIDPEVVSESYEEHAIAELALKRLLATAGDDVTFAAKVTALKELIEHHVEEEEEELFPKVEHAMDADELEALGSEMAKAFEEASEAGYESLLPEGLQASADDSNPMQRANGPEPAPKKGKRPRKPAQ
jgi:hemerythrin-like domain-containing protein